MISAILQKRHAATKIPRSNPASSHRMSRTPSSIRVVGMHPVIPSPELFNETIEIQWGAGNTSAAAPAAVREHFARLYLIEIEVDSTDAVINWSKITQPVLGQPESNWQVPYAERSVGSGRYAFFLHFVDLNQPLLTELGPLRLPKPTPSPPHLADFRYEAP